ncbi:MAG: hypothetical protein DRJ11_05960, partial [Candidatus Aminicenantes bacterium]
PQPRSVLVKKISLVSVGAPETAFISPVKFKTPSGGKIPPLCLPGVILHRKPISPKLHLSL